MKYDFDLKMEEDNSLSKIIRQIKPNSTVLEFGPAAGRMTRYLKEKLNCKVYIVEIDPESAQHAQKYSVDCVVGDIEQYEWLDKWEKISFDYITFADVLEHLRNPQTVLAKTKLILKDDGEVLFSVPNVAHNALMINLYNNVFNYTPVGLLDNTHTHLFAYNTLKEVCVYAGYTVVIEDAIYSNVGENEVCSSYEQVDDEVERILKNRLYNNVYQFVFTLKKESHVKMHETEIQRNIITYTRDYKFQVFFDRGNGWTEENSIVIMFNPNYKKQFVVDVPNPDEIVNLRIDPIDKKRIVKVESISKVYDDRIEEIDLEKIRSNAEIQIGRIYYFNTDDTNLYIENIDLNRVRQLVIKISFILQNEEEYLSAFRYALEQIKAHEEQVKQNEIQMQQNQLLIDERNNQIKLQGEELDRRLEELENRMNVINKKEAELATLNSELAKLNALIESKDEYIRTIEKELADIKNSRIYKLYKR